ncbi:hypothetical protein JVT61DRAFT_10741 [Boletus reticuloceps]|uniref:USP domain-containing protein n=1 Tax=Boletus reticuloceps TaxID=495285 RepID=A0A8I2YFB0_9AGAM|nr:hypothetical protein JVT61DRAFT_10741 [Boletus reticuloceps]
MRIRPRGLVNTGNMCLANAVLQVLIYCPPFWRLFHELGRFLDAPTDGRVQQQNASCCGDGQVPQGIYSQDKPPPEGKGEPVDRTKSGCSNEEDSLMDSFIPTYALKENKRFDHMRVSRHHQPAFPLT